MHLSPFASPKLCSIGCLLFHSVNKFSSCFTLPALLLTSQSGVMPPTSLAYASVDCSTHCWICERVSIVIDSNLFYSHSPITPCTQFQLVSLVSIFVALVPQWLHIHFHICAFGSFSCPSLYLSLEFRLASEFFQYGPHVYKWRFGLECIIIVFPF